MVVWSAGLALGGLLALSILPAGPKAYVHSKLKQGGWVVAIQRDSFAGQVHCRLRTTDRQLRYQPGAIGFHLGRRDTLNAWYRVDNGAPIRWQDRTAALMMAGVAIDGPGLDNPTGGWVWIPVDEVRSAQDVWIRAGDRGRIRHFPVRGFNAALGAAGQSGCTSDASFQS